MKKINHKIKCFQEGCKMGVESLLKLLIHGILSKVCHRLVFIEKRLSPLILWENSTLWCYFAPQLLRCLHIPWTNKHNVRRWAIVYVVMFTHVLMISVFFRLSDEDPLETLRKLQREKQCKVCMDRDTCVVFIPCGHLATCEECSQTLIKCPICCGAITQKVKTYIA